MSINLQPKLENDSIVLLPLQDDDFDCLYLVASNPEIWEQHPTKERWKKEVFQTFFKGAIESGGAFKIIDKKSGDIIGSTRFYDYSEKEESILIGYTFFSKDYWGKGINHLVKTLMFDYIFQYVSKVYLHVGAENIRSQISISRLGIKKKSEQEISYFGETPKLNFIYCLTKVEWLSLQNK